MEGSIQFNKVPTNKLVRRLLTLVHDGLNQGDYFNSLLQECKKRLSA